MKTPNTNLHRSVMWAPWEDQGLEHLRLACLPEGVSADGVIIRAKDGAVFRARYQIRCDAHWKIRETRVSSLDRGGKSRSLTSDGEGRVIIYLTQNRQFPCILATSRNVATLPINDLRLVDNYHRTFPICCAVAPGGSRL